MSKILITGSNGLLGQKIIHSLASRKEVNLVATSLGNNRCLLQEGYVYQPLDITNEKEVTSIIEKYKPDVVINTAAMTNVDACESERTACWDLNVHAVEYFVNAIQSHCPSSHFIHLSTDFIFDGTKGSEYLEDDVANPLSAYAESKYESEQIVKESGLKWSIARTIILYGIVDSMSRSNIVLWAKSALEKGDPLNVVDDQFRAPTLAEDLAEGCILIADKGAEGVFHLSGPETFSVLELVYQVADYWKLDKSLISPSKSTNLNQAASRPPYTGFVIDKARKIIGYNPRTFMEGLAIVDKQLK